MTGKYIYSSIYGKLEVPDLQSGIMKHDTPALIFLPPGTWEENVVITQPGLRIVGGGQHTILENETHQPTVTIAAPFVRLINVAIRNMSDCPAIIYDHRSAPQGGLLNVTILESGSHGVVKCEQQSEPVRRFSTIVNCDFQNVDGHGIVAVSGSGSQDLVGGNRGENIDGYFFRWSANASFLLANRCRDAPIYLTSEASANFVHALTETVVLHENDENLIF